MRRKSGGASFFHVCLPLQDRTFSFVMAKEKKSIDPTSLFPIGSHDANGEAQVCRKVEGKEQCNDLQVF